MRISDWSSDVCSSDLPRGQRRAKMDDVMTDDQGGMFRFERVLDAPLETVWAWLTELEKRKLWFADGPMELREGGAGELVFDHDTLAVADVPYPEHAIRWKGVTSRDMVVGSEPPRPTSQD